MNADPCGRSVSPAETLRRILPLRRAAGVARCADITGLDDLGVPVFCAVRPRGKALGVTNGKGLTRDQALVGAIMEAIEIHHAENPPNTLVTASFESLCADGARAIDPRTLADFASEGYTSMRYRILWAPAEDLLTHQDVWVPAALAYLCWPANCIFSSNGLASGNDADEATVHGLLELLERDAVSSLVEDGALRFDSRCKIIDGDTVASGPLRVLRERFATVGVRMVLVWIPSRIDAHTFWCTLLDERPFAGASMVRFGRATHLNPEHAAVRAVLEAAQSRLSAIHGAREDVDAQSYDEGPIHRKIASYFRGLSSNASWGELEPRERGTPRADLEYLLASFRQAGAPGVHRIDMTTERFGVSVVKLVVPGLLNHPSLF